jgi:hypothetical protein
MFRKPPPQLFLADRRVLHGTRIRRRLPRGLPAGRRPHAGTTGGAAASAAGVPCHRAARSRQPNLHPPHRPVAVERLHRRRAHVSDDTGRPRQNRCAHRSDMPAGEASTVRVAARRSAGHASTGPKGVAAQSNARQRAAISSSPGNTAREAVAACVRGPPGACSCASQLASLVVRVTSAPQSRVSPRPRARPLRAAGRGRTSGACLPICQPCP